MTRYAIILSVEEYSEFTPTNFTHADNDLFHEALTKKCDYACHHTISLKLSPAAPKSPSQILDELGKIVSSSVAGDSILFYFAGHGHFDSGTGKTYLILPNTVAGDYERTALKFEDISSVLREEDRSCFRIFDACHSGSDVRDGKSKVNSQDFVRAINNDASSHGWVTLAACKEDEYSLGDSEIGHGVFTYYLCQAIEKETLDKEILPEILKINIVDDVLKHSRKLGYIQTPTLIASISGNISLATRKKEYVSIVAEEEEIKKHTIDLERRLKKLSDVNNIITEDFLIEVLEAAAEECLCELRRSDIFGYQIARTVKIRLNSLPKEIEKNMIHFVEERGFNSRHTLKKIVESPFGLTGIAALASNKKVEYFTSQPDHMPESIAIIHMKGDERCLPDIKAIVYLIPLQITACILVSFHNYGWNKNFNEAKLIGNYFQMIKPRDSLDKIKEIGVFSSKKAIVEVTNIIKNRISQLERELSDIDDFS